jgi:hypothetical protein
MDYDTMHDGCDGDSEGLAAALGETFVVIWEDYDDSTGYGHHDARAVFRAHDGRFVRADCGGCSCGGSGSWEYVDTEAEALALVPQVARDRYHQGL